MRKFNMGSLKGIIMLVVWVSIVFAQPVTEAYSGFWVKEDHEREAGAQFAGTRAGMTYDSPLIEEIGRKVLAFHGIDPSKYSFKVLKTKNINADCGPDKHIWMYEGMIDHFSGHKGILTYVIAHEVGHANNQHWLKTMNKLYTNTFIGGLVGKAVAPNNATLQNFFIQQSQMMVLHGYGLDKEWEADRFAQYTVEKMSDVNLAIGVIYFREIWKIEEPYLAKMTAKQKQATYTNPHPLSPERAEFIMQRINEYSGGLVKLEFDGTIWLNRTRIIKPSPEKANDCCMKAGLLARAVHDKGFKSLVFKADADDNVIVTIPDDGTWLFLKGEGYDDAMTIMVRLKVAGATIEE